MLGTLRKIFDLLVIGESKKLYWLVAAIILMSMLDMLGIASIFPFLSVLSNPEVIQTNAKLKWVYEQIGFTSKDAFLIALAVVSFVILAGNNVLRGMVTVILIRFTWLKRYFISTKLLSKYLDEPYTFFLNRNSSELTTHLVSEVARVVSDVLFPCLQIFARSLLAVLILVLLTIVNPVVAAVVLGAVGGGYTIIYMFTRKRLSQVGKDIVLYNARMYKVLNETFGGIKDIKLLGKEQVFLQDYAEPVRKMVNCYSTQFLIAQVPRYAFEVMAFGGILIITTYLVVIKNAPQQVIPLVGLYAFAAYRLMPTLQQIFVDISTMRFGMPTLESIHQEFFGYKDTDEQKPREPSSHLPFMDKIEFRHITFQYPKSQRKVIEDFDLTIRTNTTVGFVGGTGAGKTTVIDILLGLLRPQQGDIVIDGLPLNEDNLRRWQANIGYVPQHIYLCDDTVTRNIAFGMPDDEIDQPAVQRAAELANIHDFIATELPKGYATKVGERGVRLSGGQRQRIGIARALYHNPSLLVFDEATSALDGITENTILEAIYKLTHQKTIIIIAHRLSTVKECDVIYLLDHGRIVAQGTYEELFATNQQFRKMAKVNEYVLQEETTR